MNRCAILVALFALGCQPGYESPPVAPPPGSIVPPTPKLKHFDLTDQDGQPFSSKSLDGKPWVGSFFFTQCPAVCWRLNQILAKWQVDHPDSKIRFVSITCDPQTDTPQALKTYADHFKADPARWTFLTGEMGYITKVARDKFLLAVQRGTHSSRAIVFDAEGNLRGAPEVTTADGEKQFKELLAEIDAESR
jgi:protein SCO1/2